MTLAAHSGTDAATTETNAALFNAAASGEIRSANVRFAELLGYQTPDDLVGRDVGDLCARPRGRRCFIELFAGRTQVADLAMIRRDGSHLVVRIGAHIAGTQDRATMQAIVLQAPRQAMPEETGPDPLDTVFVDSPIGMALYDTKSRRADANPALLRLLGYDNADFVRLTLADIIHPEDHERARHALVDLAGGSATRAEAELRLLTARGETVWTLVHASAIERGPVPEVLIQILNVTHRRADLEARTRAGTEPAPRAARSRWPARGNVTRRFTSRRQMEQPASGRPTLETVAIAPESDMAKIIEGLLATAALEARFIEKRTSSFDLLELANSVANHNPAVSAVQAPDGSVTALGDPRHVRQIITHLVANGERYGGPPIDIAINRVDGMAAVDVRDRGKGLPRNRWHSIFDPSLRDSSEHRDGVGIGLALDRERAKTMKGDLLYTYSPGLSTFRLLLPLAS